MKNDKIVVMILGSFGLSCMVWGVPFICMIMTGQLALAMTLAMSGSRRPLTSLMSDAPFSRAQSATLAFWVSIEMGSVVLLFKSTSFKREISVSASMGMAPGRVDSAPRSILFAPSFSSVSMCCSARFVWV